MPMESGMNNNLKVLWFTNTPSLYFIEKGGYNGGGWISSLEQIVSNENSIDLAVCFFHSDDRFKIKRNNTVYYPISLYKSKLSKLIHNLFYHKFDKIETDYYLRVIDDFQPDIIHIFGTERSFGLITRKIKIPVVIHLQGILNSCLNAYFAPGMNIFQSVLNYLFSPKILFEESKKYIFLKYNAKRELEILSNATYFLGRTDWDKSISKLYSPDSLYFYCSEVLRDVFYESPEYKYINKNKFILVTTMSKTSYKGFDLVLKTAKLLKERSEFDFEWKIFGIKEYKEWELILGINSFDVNVKLMGVAGSSQLVKNILEADIYINTSYIDNSPNSVCEAQLVGIPIISTNVGGISSLISDGISGYLVPANDPFTLVSKIIKIIKNRDNAKIVANKGRIVALERHNKETIKKDLFNCYSKLINAN